MNDSIEKYYKEKCTGFPVEVVWIDQKKEKGVRAKKSFSRGDVIFTEFPHLCIQLEGNKKDVKCCSYCLKSVERPDVSLARYIPKDKMGALPFMNECCPEVKGVQCNLCSEFYCSELCKNVAAAKYHKWICIGTLPTQCAHSLKNLISFCRHNSNHIPLQMLRLFAMMVSSVEAGMTIEKAFEPFSYYKADSEQNPSYYYIEHMRKFEDAFYSTQHRLLKDKLHKSIFYLIKSILCNKQQLEPLFTWEKYRYLLGVLSLNAESVVPLAPYMRYWNNIKSLSDSNKRDAALAQLIPILSHLPRNLRRVESSRGSGLFRIANCVNHSCVPNIMFEFNEEDGRMSAVALRDIAPQEELLQCYVNPNLNREQRQLILQGQYLFECKCERCNSERDAFSIGDLLRIHKASRMDEYEDDEVKDKPLTFSLLINSSQNGEEDVDFKLSIVAPELTLTSLTSAEKQLKLNDIILKKIISATQILKLHNKDSNAVWKDLGFKLVIAASSLSNAGSGVFVEGEVQPGTLLCFYAGVMYKKEDINSFDDKMKNYFSSNEYLLTQSEGYTIDGKIHDSEFRDHPLAVGSFINHPTPGSFPNVFTCDCELSAEMTTDLLAFVPNKIFTSSGQTVPINGVKPVVAIAARVIKNEELFMDYKYPFSTNLPSWYMPLWV